MEDIHSKPLCVEKISVPNISKPSFVRRDLARGSCENGQLHVIERRRGPELGFAREIWVMMTGAVKCLDKTRMQRCSAACIAQRHPLISMDFHIHCCLHRIAPYRLPAEQMGRRNILHLLVRLLKDLVRQDKRHLTPKTREVHLSVPPS